MLSVDNRIITQLNYSTKQQSYKNECNNQLRMWNANNQTENVKYTNRYMECAKKPWTTNSNNTSEVLNSYRDLSMVIICKKTWPICSGWRATMLIAQLKIKILLKSTKWRKISSKIYQMKSCSTYIISGHIISSMWPTFHYIFIDFVELHMWHDFTRPELTLTS